MRKLKWVLLFVSLIGLLFAAPSAHACGGFFCTNVPVDQVAERIIFAVNDDGTIDAYVQINYTGAPDAFAWVVPVPNPPKVDVAVDPVDGTTLLSKGLPNAVAVVDVSAKRSVVQGFIPTGWYPTAALSLGLGRTRVRLPGLVGPQQPLGLSPFPVVFQRPGGWSAAGIGTPGR